MVTKVTHYRRNLPHIHPEGYPLFITFRLADSLPSEVLIALKTQREHELSKAKRTSLEVVSNIEKKHFSRYDTWLDRCASGPRWLGDKQIAGIIAEKLHSMDGKYFQVIAYCILPNHIHILIESVVDTFIRHHGKTANYPVTDALRLLKGSTARACNQKLERSGQFWNHESYDHYVRNEQELERIIKYIVQNPVKAGLVKDWK